MGLKGLLDRNDDPSDVESERQALRRQRAEAAAELETLKRTLSERVAAVQQRERELADALARVEKREQKLDAAAERGSRLESVRLRLAEAKEARATRETEPGESVDSTQSPTPVTAAEKKLPPGRRSSTRWKPGSASANAGCRARGGARALAAGARSPLRGARRSRAGARGARGRTCLDTGSRNRRRARRIEAKLAELAAAEEAFARTHAELAGRSDALSEQEAALAARERAVAAKESTPELDALDARISRLEQGGRKRGPEPPSFSAGLRALEERGLRAGRAPDEPLH